LVLRWDIWQRRDFRRWQFLRSGIWRGDLPGCIDTKLNEDELKYAIELVLACCEGTIYCDGVDCITSCFSILDLAVFAFYLGHETPFRYSIIRTYRSISRSIIIRKMTMRTSGESLSIFSWVR
jgi:hypothetical protein